MRHGEGECEVGPSAGPAGRTGAGKMSDVSDRCQGGQASLLKSTLEPEDMTGVVLFLACDESSKMTGQVLINDAGTWFSG